MKCKHAQKMIIDYINGSLGPEEIRIIHGHAEGCQYCHLELEMAKKVIDLTSNVKVEYPPENIWNNFLPDLHKRIESEAALTFKKNQRQRFYFLPGWAASIATVILVIITSFFLTYHPSLSSIEINSSKVTQVTTDTKPSMIRYGSEPLLIADIISDVLITETQMAELKKLENYSRPESLYYYYDDALNDVLVELDSIKENDGLIRSLLNNELAEFDDSQMLDSSIDEYGSM